MRAEGDQIVTAGACSDAGGIIISIRVGLGTSHLEDPWISRGLASLGASKAPGATVPGRVERKASTLASHHSPFIVRPDLETHGAHHVQVADTPSVAAFSGAFDWGDGDGEVVAVHEADIVEVLVVTEGDLREGGGWGAADAIAEEWATAVASGAAAASGGVEGAAVAAPEAAGPEGGKVEGVDLLWWELEAAAG